MAAQRVNNPSDQFNALGCGSVPGPEMQKSVPIAGIGLGCATTIDVIAQAFEFGNDGPRKTPPDRPAGQPADRPALAGRERRLASTRQCGWPHAGRRCRVLAADGRRVTCATRRGLYPSAPRRCVVVAASQTPNCRDLEAGQANATLSGRSFPAFDPFLPNLRTTPAQPCRGQFKLHAAAGPLDKRPKIVSTRALRPAPQRPMPLMRHKVRSVQINRPARGITRDKCTLGTAA